MVTAPRVPPLPILCPDLKKRGRKHQSNKRGHNGEYVTRRAGCCVGLRERERLVQDDFSMTKRFSVRSRVQGSTQCYLVCPALRSIENKNKIHGTEGRVVVGFARTGDGHNLWQGSRLRTSRLITKRGESKALTAWTIIAVRMSLKINKITKPLASWAFIFIFFLYRKFPR